MRVRPPWHLVFAGLALVLACACTAPSAPCVPTLEATWIRAMPPGATSLAGYGVLRNACSIPVTVVGAQGADFASVAVHETMDHGGMSHMQAVHALVVAPGTSVEFAPGGTHLMLMQPKRALQEGTRSRIGLQLADGRRVEADFPVRRDAPAAR